MNQMNDHKKRSVEYAMSTGMVAIYIDATRTHGLPEQHRDNPQLMLELGYNLPIPTNDLRCYDDAIHVTLSFGRVPHAVTIPYAALEALNCDAFYTQWPRDTAPPVTTSKPTGLRLVGK